MVFNILKKYFLCTRSSLLESVIVTEFQATEAYSSLDLTKAKYSISRLSMVEKENVSVRINPNSLIACVIIIIIIIIMAEQQQRNILRMVIDVEYASSLTRQ
jgi:hypothetical protein